MRIQPSCRVLVDGRPPAVTIPLTVMGWRRGERVILFLWSREFPRLGLSMSVLGGES